MELNKISIRFEIRNGYFDKHITDLGKFGVAMESTLTCCFCEETNKYFVRSDDNDDCILHCGYGDSKTEAILNYLSSCLTGDNNQSYRKLKSYQQGELLLEDFAAWLKVSTVELTEFLSDC